MLEGAFRQALTGSQGDISIFFVRPISLAMLIFSGAVIFYPLVTAVWGKKKRREER
jgi:TctA family transporter